MHTLPPRFLLPLAFGLAVAACGQTGPLYLPPTCSPVTEDGRVIEETDEDGKVLPPCPPPEPEDEFRLPAEDHEQDRSGSDELNQDFR